ncbi:uncharacterized protein LOC116301861 [Actinia tenebrosa]|uniref:Uncharacterized protein LOC116301861 n=1 Tax=Actinia tenebrosa TaxID=6105 RepID=A0A6P8IJB0_ACTTE|nr:uncharacterized protein LOC116301861 [Actinia tenebrosa]
MEGLPYETFFTEDDFESFTSQPSLLQYLQTFITRNEDKTILEREVLENIQVEAFAKKYGFDNQETSRGVNELDILKNINKIAKIESGLEIEYPKLSFLSKEDHKTFIVEYEKAVKGVVLDDTRRDNLKEMKAKVVFEQQEFQQFVYQYVRSNAGKYNSIPSEAKEVSQVSSLEEKRIKMLKHYYHLNQTVGLSVGAHFRSDPVLEFQDILLQVGDVPILVEPTDRIKLILADANICRQRDNFDKGPLLLSEDPVALRVAKEHSVNIVVSSSCLQTLIDNQAPQFNQQWDIPVIVSEIQQRIESPKDKPAHKIVFLEKPLPKKFYTPNQLMTKTYKRSLMKELCQTDNVRAKNFVYSLWKFGKFRLLIRSKLDAYKTDKNTKVQSFLSVVAKPEFQWQFGYERLTPSETARWWLKTYIRPNTTVLCARIKRQNNEVLRVDEMTPPDVLSSGSAFNPAQGMKLVYQIFNSLAQLACDSYLLTHERFAIHCCLYKNAQHSTTKKKPELDINARYSKPITVVDFTSIDVSWSGIDTELFLAEHIEQKRIPATFPAVNENILKEIEKQKQKQMELMFPANAVMAPGKKKKKKKKSQAKKRRLDAGESEREVHKPLMNFKPNYDYSSAGNIISSQDGNNTGTEEPNERGGYRLTGRRSRPRPQARRQFLSYRDLDYSGFD